VFENEVMKFIELGFINESRKRKRIGFDHRSRIERGVSVFSDILIRKIAEKRNAIP